MTESPVLFSAFQVAPAGEMYEAEFLSLVASVESQSSHPAARQIADIAKKNNLPLRPVIAFQEFPGSGLGGAVDLGNGTYRAVVVGTREFLKECGLQVPELLEVAARRWEGESAVIALGGWDGWVRGVLKFTLDDQ